MGSFFTNCQIRSQSAEGCRRAAASIVAASCLVTDSKNGWVSLFDEQSESQDLQEIQRVAKAFSSKLATAVFGFLVHDSDMFVYVLHDKGKLVDQFNSCPDCLGPVSASERKKWAGQFKKLLPLVPKKASLTAIQNVLGKKRTFEEEKVRDFARLMGIDEERACTGFKYLQESDHGFTVVYGKHHSADSAALLAAAEKGDLAQVRVLLQRKTSPNILDRFGRSLLVASLTLQRNEMALALLEAGADPFFGDRGDAVWAAASHGNRAVLAKLLQNRPKQLMASFPEALNSAVAMGQGEVVEDLLKAGADPNTRDAAGRTPLITACSRGHQMIWEVLAGQKFPTRPGEKPTDWEAMVDALLKAGADVNAQDKNGMTALMMARSAGQNQIVERLQRAGANPDLKPDGEKLRQALERLKSAAGGDAAALQAGMSHLDPRFRKAALKVLNKKKHE